MATLQTKPQEGTSKSGGVRRIRVSVRTIGPWSVLKLSLIYYFCVMLVVIFGLAILYMLLQAIGVLDSIETLLGGVGFGGFQFETFSLFRTLFLIGFITVIVGSAFTVFLAFLYNLISDLVGGIELTLVERR